MVETAHVRRKIALIAEKLYYATNICTSYKKSLSLNTFPMTNLRPFCVKSKHLPSTHRHYCHIVSNRYSVREIARVECRSDETGDHRWWPHYWTVCRWSAATATAQPQTVVPSGHCYHTCRHTCHCRSRTWPRGKFCYDLIILRRNIGNMAKQGNIAMFNGFVDTGKVVWQSLAVCYWQLRHYNIVRYSAITYRFIEMVGLPKSKCSSSWLPITTFTCIVNSQTLIPAFTQHKHTVYQYKQEKAPVIILSMTAYCTLYKNYWYLCCFKFVIWQRHFLCLRISNV